MLACKALATLLVDLSQIPLHDTTVEETLTTGSRATMVVPFFLPFLFPLELISKLPPNCRILSRIPLIPTPPPASRVDRRSFLGRYAFTEVLHLQANLAI